MKRIVMVVNEDRFFLSHRLPIALAVQKNGFEVTLITKDTGLRKWIEEYGIQFIDLPINPTGMNLKEEFKTLKFLYTIYKKEKPDIVHHVGLKNILWGGAAAKLSRIKAIVNAYSGLGGLFNGAKISITAKAVLLAIKLSNSKKRVRTIFQNPDDIEILLKSKSVLPEQIYTTNGSGIDLEEFSYTYPYKNQEKIHIIFTGRMVKEKGIMDLIEAAKILYPEYKNKIKFILCGRITPNNSGISEQYLKENCDGHYLEWLGEINNIKEFLKKSDIMVFPSYYREGIPKSLIEACAIGRPIITCNSVGCKEAVEDGKNGILVPPQNPPKLAEAIRSLIDNPDLRVSMGKAARKKAEKEFSIEDVIKTHLEIYNSFL